MGISLGFGTLFAKPITLVLVSVKILIGRNPALLARRLRRWLGGRLAQNGQAA